MARTKEFAVAPNPVLVVLAKVLDAKRGGQTLAERDRYNNDPAMQPGQHRARGQLAFDITYSVGEQAEAARYYSTPIDAILLYAFLLSGALREHFIRAAKILMEVRAAELEGEDGTPRPYKDISYTVMRKRGKKNAKVQVTIPAAEVAEAAEVVAGKLLGDETDEDRALTLEQVADCLAKLKTVRKYDGPINLEEVEMNLREFANLRIAVGE